MARQIDPMISAIPYYALMTAMDKVGINPGLLSRQTSTAITPIMRGIMENFLGVDQLPKTLNEFFEMEKSFFKIGNICDAEKMQVTCKDGTSVVKILDCSLKEVANFAKSAGYKQCPMCIVGALTIGSIKAMNLGDIKNFKVEKNGDCCTISLMSD
jgi:hypothetical protein